MHHNVKYVHLLDFLEDGRVLNDTHADKLLSTPVLIKNVVGVFPELLHVSPDKHLAELHEVTVVFVVDLDNTPRIRTATNLAAVRGVDNPVRTNNRERNFARNLLRLGHSFLIFVLVRRRLEDLDLVILDVRQHLPHVTGEYIEVAVGLKIETHPGLELGNLLVGEGICLGNNGNQVHFGVQLTHELDVNWLQTRNGRI